MDNLWNEIWKVLNTSITQIQERDLSLLSLIQVVLIIFIAWFLSRTLTPMLRRVILGRVEFGDTVENSIAKGFRFTILFIGIYVAISSIGFDLAILLVPLGGLSVGIGFGAQDLAKNLIAGVITMSEQRVRRGQVIEIRGMRGTVESIGLRSTTVRMEDGIQLMLANGDFMSQPVKIISESDDDEEDSKAAD
ncbi:MAG: mechanosensitive ion channel [Chloroflexota bacterium]|jgi:small-conductance mechanosensitive channel|nr:mechanosensitive ion channel [Chloroflexota bacterium]MDP6509310.1 mechanosensitive ion channel [Chloroflexota bacterium]MDP6758172.1 mechanosensitive ion channel [Chloroflexota bacterium]